MYAYEEPGWEPWKRLQNRTPSGIQAQQQSKTMRLQAIKTFNSRKHKLLCPKRPESPAKNIHLPNIRKSKFQLFYRPKPSKKSYSLLLDYQSPLPEETSSNHRPNVSHSPIFSTIFEDYSLEEDNKLRKEALKHIRDSYQSLNNAFKAPIEGLEGCQIPIKSKDKNYIQTARVPSKFQLLAVERNKTPVNFDSLPIEASKIPIDRSYIYKHPDKSPPRGYHLLRNSMDTPTHFYKKLKNRSLFSKNTRNLFKEPESPTARHKRGRTEIGISTDENP